MRKTNTTHGKIRQLFIILFPLLITQLSLYAMSFFDIMMSGRYSTADVAGVSIGSSLWMPIYSGLGGILLAIPPIISQLIGAKDIKKVPFNIIQAIYLALAIGVAITIIGFILLNPILSMMNLEPAVEQVAHSFLVGLGYGILPLFVFNVLRSFMDGLGQTRISMLITLSALPINITFNYFLIYGKFGFPELGGVGSGYATAITYWLIFIIALIVVVKVEPFASYRVFKRFYRLSLKSWKTLLVIGLPIGFSIFFETSIFAAVTLFMSSYDTITIASHQIAMNFASFLYMAPLSISMGLTIVVAFEVGAKRYSDAREYSKIGISIAVILSLICSLVIFFLREQVASIYTDDQVVIKLTTHFLIYAIFFQISDAFQAPIQGILRGYKDVNFTFFMSLVSYWVIGLPFGYTLANFTDLGPFGYWIGLISGLAIGAIGLLGRLLYLQKVKYPSTQKSV
ncbi:MATE family efflux transporter [Peribacillus huizhouensis]|uniref:Probable multidrug resistance protein NorM n=1 Tax=Peribacillus huizhouensis TaxID=1501239 RepID=A0ABR6CRM6_9BACI|nr:MATE family efflux transporter [Peribacillus huizhouensis]MBA9027679.1 MATE family multidrug resistance protein [Peribacillus huizhouensis]